MFCAQASLKIPTTSSLTKQLTFFKYESNEEDNSSGENLNSEIYKITWRELQCRNLFQNVESYNAGLSDFFMENDEQMTIKFMPPQGEISLFVAVVSLPWL